MMRRNATTLQGEYVASAAALACSQTCNAEHLHQHRRHEKPPCSHARTIDRGRLDYHVYAKKGELHVSKRPCKQAGHRTHPSRSTHSHGTLLIKRDGLRSPAASNPTAIPRAAKWPFAQSNVGCLPPMLGICPASRQAMQFAVRSAFWMAAINVSSTCRNRSEHVSVDASSLAQTGLAHHRNQLHLSIAISMCATPVRWRAWLACGPRGRPHLGPPSKMFFAGSRHVHRYSCD
jgi:hypothetical protein